MTKLAMLLSLAAMALCSQVTVVLADEVPTYDVDRCSMTFGSSGGKMEPHAPVR
jgi:hypothetical protein